ncbi:RDD family protein [Microbacterium algeriense]|uniref:RDD family protein n=1 Tax=Microbacterium algeriense TaxID=2615184 RepID=UPI0022E8A926|nr:RDD family protein [Microbacterium algeriense]
MTQPALDQIAPISRRAIAYLIDALIAGGLGVVLGGALILASTLSGSLEASIMTLFIGGPIVGLLLLAWFIVYTLMQAGAGSIGMRSQGLRLVSAADGTPLGFGRSLLRNIIFGLAAAIVVGYFSPLFDGSGRFQGWHDKVASSLMLDARIPAPEPVVEEAPEPPAPPLLPAPSFERLPPAPMPGFAPAAPAAPTTAPTPDAAPVARDFAAPAQDSGMIAYVPGITQDAPPSRRSARSDADAAAPSPAPAAPPAPAVPAPVAEPPAAAVPAAPPVPPAPPVPLARAAGPAAAAAPASAPSAPAGAPAPAAPVAAAPTPEPADDLEETRISIPGHRLVFTWDDGTRIPVSRRTVFGRNPAPEEGALVVPVRDETLSLSKTHFEAAAETSGGWVVDRHSTNGLTIVRDGQRIACPAGQRVPIKLGDVIEIGDRVVMVGGYA